MDLKDLLNKTLYYIPCEFIDNCKKGIKTPIHHVKIVGPFKNSLNISQYKLIDNNGNEWLTTEYAILDSANAKIGGKRSCIFGGIETICEGLYQTFNEAKKQMENYINSELKRIEKSIRSLEERSENFKRCLW